MQQDPGRSRPVRVSEWTYQVLGVASLVLGTETPGRTLAALVDLDPTYRAAVAGLARSIAGERPEPLRKAGVQPAAETLAATG